MKRISSLLDSLRERGLKITTAESCTGGMIASSITDVPGSSDVFGRGFVTYSNEAKIDLLGVKLETLEKFGAVSEQTVREMVQGALANSNADIAIATTGIAGPGGGTEEKPVGLVYIGISRYSDIRIIKLHLSGNRQQVRKETVERVLQLIESSL